MNWKVFFPSFSSENMLQHHYSIKSSSLKVAWMKESFLSFQRADNSLKIVFKIKEWIQKHLTAQILFTLFC